MASRFVKLKDEWLLRGWLDIPWSLVNWKNGVFYELKQESFFVAESCNGKTDFSSPVFLPRHIDVLKKFIDEGIVEECKQGEKTAPIQEYRKANNMFVRGIHWAVTGRCNLNCRHCYMEAPYREQPEISFQDIMCLLDKFEQANVMEVSLTGGEPFMREDLLRLIEQLTARRIRLADIYTNATMITDTTLKRLKDFQVWPVFRVSFDGCGRHDLMRGTPGAEEAVIDAIRRIQKAGFKVAVTTCLDKTNLDCLMSTYELMKALDIYAWGIGRPQPVGCAKGLTTGLSLDEMVEPCEMILECWLADERPFMIGLEAFYSGTKDRVADERLFSLAQDFSADSYACSSCRQWPHLAHDGKLMPCISYGDTAWIKDLPVLLTTDLGGALQDPALGFLLDIKKSDVLAFNPECTDCQLLRQCGSGCRTSALIVSGNLMAKDTMACKLWKGGYKKHFTDKVAAWRQTNGG